jgi:membrane-bound lytic murein transglycosylase D
MRSLTTAFLSSILGVSLLASSAVAQSPKQPVLHARTATPATVMDPKSQAIIDRAEYLYQAGEQAFGRNDFDRARRLFDDSVDAILVSNVDLREDAPLRAFYAQLVEKIHTHQVLAQGKDVGGFADQVYVPAESEIAVLSDAELKALGDVETTVDGKYNFTFTVGSPVYQFINYFTLGRGRGTMESGLRRSGRYRKMAERIFKEEGVPTDLIWLAQVESVWKPAALSHAAAKGIWQFIPSTGRRFGLDQNQWVDERSSPEDSTRAAARYLKWLYNYFAQDWLLAMAAYNSGEGNVGRAIARSGYADFWEIHRAGFLPNETRNYVPAILAVIIVAHNQKRYNFNVTPEPALVYDLAQVPAQTDLEIAAELCGTSVDFLREINPELRRGSTPPWAHTLRIPNGKKKGFETAYAALPPDQRMRRLAPAPTDVLAVSGSSGSETRSRSVTNRASGFGGGNSLYTARPGDTLTAIAARHGVTATELARANNISSNTRVRSGQALKVPGKSAASEKYSTREVRKVTYRGKNAPQEKKASPRGKNAKAPARRRH